MAEPDSVHCLVGDDAYSFYVLATGGIGPNPDPSKYIVHFYSFVAGFYVQRVPKVSYLVDVPDDFPENQRKLPENINALTATGHNFNMRLISEN